MAAPNWKNVPASAFRAGKPRIRRPVLAAQFSSPSSELEDSSAQTQRGCTTLENKSADISGSGRGLKRSVFSSTGEGTAETSQTAPQPNQHTLSIELQSMSSTLPSKSSSHDHTPDSGLPAEADVLLSPSDPGSTNSHVTDIRNGSTPPPCFHSEQFSSKKSSVSQIGETARPTPSDLHQEQQKQALEMPYKFSGFPSTAFKISPMSGILGRLLPLRSFSYVSGSGHSSSKHHSSATEEMMDLGLDLDEEASLAHVSEGGAEVTPLVKEEGSREGSVTADPLLEKTVEEDRDVSHNSFLAMDVEGLLLEACSKTVSKEGVWAKYPNRSELSSGVDVERVVLEHRTEQKQKRYHSKRVRGPIGRGQTDKAEGGATVKKKRLRARKNTEEEEEEEEDGEGGGRAVGQRPKGKSRKPKKPSPNTFIAVRVPSRQIRSGLEAVQKGMLEKEKLVRSTLTSLKKLHITLSVIRLEKGDEERAKSALFDATQKAVADLCLSERPLTLEFSGLASFGKRVVFASLVEGEGSERLRAVSDIVRSVFDQHGFPDTDGRMFSPHLTIAKMSAYREQRRRGRLSRQRRLTGITEEYYGEFKDAEFGVQKVTGLELLSMTEPEDKDGYYHCFQRLSFDEISTVKSLPVEQQENCVSGSSEQFLSPETKSSGTCESEGEV